MGWPGKTGRRALITRDDALGCTPVKNRHVRETHLESGEVLVHYPATVRPWVARLARFLGKESASPRTGKLQLDELGTAVWGMIDGERNLRRIVAAFAASHQLDPKEAEIAVTQFVRELGRRGLVGLH
jgi:Coenzyme PQQ synthesis protein D (PqqD)